MPQAQFPGGLHDFESPQEVLTEKTDLIEAGTHGHGEVVHFQARGPHLLSRDEPAFHAAVRGVEECRPTFGQSCLSGPTTTHRDVAGAGVHHEADRSAVDGAVKIEMSVVCHGEDDLVTTTLAAATSYRWRRGDGAVDEIPAAGEKADPDHCRDRVASHSQSPNDLGDGSITLSTSSGDSPCRRSPAHGRGPSPGRSRRYLSGFAAGTR